MITRFLIGCLIFLVGTTIAGLGAYHWNLFVTAGGCVIAVIGGRMLIQATIRK